MNCLKYDFFTINFTIAGPRHKQLATNALLIIKLMISCFISQINHKHLPYNWLAFAFVVT